jgi:hypothetical protein
MQDPAIYPVERLELSFVPQPWTFADERRAAIGACFAQMQNENPKLWNGRVLLLCRHRLEGGVFHGVFLETDYASFACWRRLGCPPAAVHDCFAAAAILARDGAVLLGVMGAHTFNAGQVYFTCGTPEPSDVVGGKVDFEASVGRELAEETGLAATDVDAEPGWTAVVDGPLIAQIKVFRVEEKATALRERILARLAREAEPELVDIRIVRVASDLDAAMPRYVTAFLDWWWRGR